MQSRLLLAGCIAVAAAVQPVDAIVIRHDVDTESYRANPGDWPFVFGIYRSSKGHPDCLAVLVAPGWALTAAHCTQDPPLVEALAGGGSHGVTIGGRDNAIDRIERHPSWTGDVTSESFDLALVHLERPVEGIEPVPINRSDSEVGRIVTMVGWGDHGTGLTGPATADGHFRMARNRVDSADSYWLRWDFSDPEQDEGVVRLEGISGPGDSGGPAFLGMNNGLTLAGISSSQLTGGGTEGRYGVTELYARVSGAVEWIQATIPATELQSGD